MSDLFDDAPVEESQYGTIFGGERLPYQRHSATSRAAAESKGRTGTAATERGRILQLLVSSGNEGRTDEEIQAELKLGTNSHRARRIELVQRNLVRDSGRKRPTNSGHSATVWVALTRDGS